MSILQTPHWQGCNSAEEWYHGRMCCVPQSHLHSQGEVKMRCPDCDCVVPDDALFCECGWMEDGEEYEDDGQPDEYTEWQDFMGGDDWDQGQYDE